MEEIRFFSTNHKSPAVSFREALLRGQAPDRGLYMPQNIPRIPEEEIASFSRMTYPEIAYHVTRPYLHDQLPETDLIKLLEDAYDFKVPLEPVFDRNFILRLDQGPTASFKDFAARMMGRLMQYYLNQDRRKLLILTATSGDTGSAIANAFYGLDLIQVTVLFPINEVTARQRKQMTTLGRNICILGLEAKFDDCQALVKQAFSDPDLADLNLSSANSINIGRLLPQTVYYFYAYSRLRDPDGLEPIVFSVPSGNFGDLMGGLMAWRMGLPVKEFVVATNENDEFPQFLKTGKYQKIIPSLNCISSAMNVGHPSNLARVVTLYEGRMDETGTIQKQPDLDQMRRQMTAFSISDTQTETTIQDAYRRWGLLLEPHGAAGFSALLRYLESGKANPSQLCVSLETAHPAKFPEKIRELLEIEPELPRSLEGIETRQEHYDQIPNSYQEFKKVLLEKYGTEQG